MRSPAKARQEQEEQNLDEAIRRTSLFNSGDEEQDQAEARYPCDNVVWPCLCFTWTGLGILTKTRDICSCKAETEALAASRRRFKLYAAIKILPSLRPARLPSPLNVFDSFRPRRGLLARPNIDKELPLPRQLAARPSMSPSRLTPNSIPVPLPTFSLVDPWSAASSTPS
jgi:hypothetical protein